MAGGIWSHLKYSQKIPVSILAENFCCTWSFKLSQRKKRQFAFEMRVQSAQCELLTDLSRSCHGIPGDEWEFNTYRTQGFYLAVPWNCGLEHNKAELLSKKGVLPNTSNRNAQFGVERLFPCVGSDTSLWHSVLDLTLQATGEVLKMSPNFCFITWFWLTWKSSDFCHSILKLSVCCTGN